MKVSRRSMFHAEQDVLFEKALQRGSQLHHLPPESPQPDLSDLQVPEPTRAKPPRRIAFDLGPLPRSNPL